jgi:hypothetical protein
MRILRLAGAASTLLVAACGGGGSGSDAPTTPAVKANTTYQGVFASGVERGTLSLVAGSPATGTLTIGAAQPVPLSGTFTAANSSFAMTGGGYSLMASAGAGGTIKGTVTGGNITGTGVVAALEAPSTATPTRYCGVYTGDDAGMVEFTVLGSSAVAVVNGMGGGFTMNGSVSGSSATLTATGTEPGTGRTNTVTAIITLSGSSLAGSGSSTLYPTQRVNITASTQACGAPTALTGPFTTFVGWLGNNGVSGTISITAGAPATASVTWNGGSPVSLSGTYNAVTGAFALSGGGISVSATANSAGTLSGTASGLPTGPSSATIGALGGTGTSPVTRFCGATTSGVAAKIVLMQNGTTMTGLMIWSSGSAALSGTASGGTIYLTAGPTLFVSGTGGGASLSGTYSHANSNIGAGSWTASGC